MLEINLLGPLEARRNGAPVPLGGPKQRAVLALLALRPGRVLPAEQLLDALWDSAPPPTALTALQGHVSRLRRLLGAEAIVTRGGGYALQVEPDTVDLVRFERLVETASHEPPPARAELLREALGLWRGPAPVELGEEAPPLDELRLTVQEDLADAELSLGRHAELVADLEAAAHAEPLRERRVEQLMLALYRSGRQADALEVYRRYRQHLRDLLGLDPGPELRELEHRVLGQDPALAPPGSRGREEPLRRTPLTAVAVGLSANGDHDAEAYGRAVAAAREAVRLALERHGGSVERLPGATVLGLFGLPAPHEDDALRAVRAARDAVDSAVAGDDRFGVRLAARAGVATGDAFGGESPAIEQAVRLMGDAHPGALIIDDATRAIARERHLRLDRALVGRQEERTLLRRAYEQVVRTRRARLVTLVGPAGIGKSRLAADLVASLELGVRVLRTRCLSYGDGISMLSASELVRSAIAAELGDDEAGARALLEPLLAGDERGDAAIEQLLGLLGLADVAADDEETAWGVRRLIEGIARRGPVVVLVDDLHWSTPAFLRVIEQLAQPADVALLVVATARSAPSLSCDPGTIAVRPLDEAACAQVVAGLLGSAAVDERALTLLAETSGGNPLFLEELVVDLRLSGRLTESGGRWTLAGAPPTVPRSIQALLAARLERLPGPERELLCCASVTGRSFTRAALAELADGDLDEPLAALVAADLIVPFAGERADYAFRHLLIRDAAYASLPLEVRADLHRRYAAWIDRSSFASRLELEALAVYHLDQAHRAESVLVPGTPHDAALVERSAQLGRMMLARGDAAAAVHLLARACELEPGHAVEVDLGRAHFDVGDLAAAAEAFERAEAGAASTRARLGLVEVRLHTDPAYDLDMAAAEIDAAFEVLRRSGDADGLQEAWHARAYLALVRGRAGELGETLEAALAHARRAGQTRAETWILFLVCGSCWFGPMPAEDGIRRCEQVLAGARGRQNVEAAALQSLAVLRAMRDEFGAARQLVRASREIRRDVGQQVGAAASSMDEGIVELLAGDFGAAERVLRDGYAELERLGEKGYFSTIASLLAEALQGQGRLDEARSFARAAAEAASEDDVATQVGWRATEARALAAAGAGTDAERLAHEATVLADRTDFLLLRAEAWTALADVTGDEEARARATALLEEKGCAAGAIAAWTAAR